MAVGLSVPVTSFIGRHAEGVHVKRILGTARLLTLTGAGGVGKTRLALEVARDVSASYADGVVFVELASLGDPDLVAPSIAAAVGFRDVPGAELMEMLQASLGPRHMLLILDNCEHLLAATAAVAELLLDKCPRMTILATSRQALSLAAETVWPVPPLS